MHPRIAAALLSLGVSAAWAQEDFGIGAIVAEPTGITAKAWFNGNEAIDAAAAWSFSDHDSFQFHTDYLYHRFDLFPNVDQSVGRLALYFGAGARLKLGEDNGRGNDDADDRLGLRVPAGMTYLFTQAPFDVFGEVVPVLDIAPDTELDLQAAVGGRFYFGRRQQLMRQPERQPGY
jgi:hypothetical protein